jgi:hypothetical protein
MANWVPEQSEIAWNYLQKQTYNLSKK